MAHDPRCALSQELEAKQTLLDQVHALATDDPDFFLDLLELIAALDASIVDNESLVDGAKAVLDKLQARRGAAENRTELRRQLLAHTLQQIRLKTLLQQGRAGCGLSGLCGYRGVRGRAVAWRTGACAQAGDLPAGADQTRVYTEGQRPAHRDTPPPPEARLIVQVRIVISKGYTRRFKRSRFSRAFFSSRSLAHLTMMANRKKNETIKKIGLVTSSSSK